MSTSQKIAGFIVDQIMDGECDIDLAAEENLLLTGIVDSLGVMRLVAWLEEEFDFAISPTDVTLENFKNIESMAAYVSEKVG